MIVTGVSGGEVVAAMAMAMAATDGGVQSGGDGDDI